MLFDAKTLLGFEVHAVDGDIGHVADLLFDDEKWGIRYIVVETGTWLRNRQVLLSPRSLDHVDEESQKLYVKLTMEKVEHSPEADILAVVTREWEARYNAYYGWPAYWSGPGVWGTLNFPVTLSTLPPSGQTVPGLVMEDEPAEPVDEHGEEAHLQSARVVMGFHVEANDGLIGHVVDFLTDDETWAIRYIEIDTGNWWPGKKVLIAPQWTSGVSWLDSRLLVEMPREVLKNSPPYDPTIRVDREYEEQLQDYYRRQG